MHSRSKLLVSLIVLVGLACVNSAGDEKKSAKFVLGPQKQTLILDKPEFRLTIDQGTWPTGTGDPWETNADSTVYDLVIGECKLIVKVHPVCAHYNDDWSLHFYDVPANWNSKIIMNVPAYMEVKNGQFFGVGKDDSRTQVRELSCIPNYKKDNDGTYKVEVSMTHTDGPNPPADFNFHSDTIKFIPFDAAGYVKEKLGLQFEFIIQEKSVKDFVNGFLGVPFEFVIPENSNLTEFVNNNLEVPFKFFQSEVGNLKSYVSNNVSIPFQFLEYEKPDEPEKEKCSGVTIGEAIGIVLGCSLALIVLLAILSIILYILMRKREQKKAAQTIIDKEKTAASTMGTVGSQYGGGPTQTQASQYGGNTQGAEFQQIEVLKK